MLSGDEQRVLSEIEGYLDQDPTLRALCAGVVDPHAPPATSRPDENPLGTASPKPLMGARWALALALLFVSVDIVLLTLALTTGNALFTLPVFVVPLLAALMMAVRFHRSRRAGPG